MKSTNQELDLYEDAIIRKGDFMKPKKPMLSILVVLFLAIATIAIGHTKDDKFAGKMSMKEMMDGCHNHCQDTSKAIDQVLNNLNQAKASNDRAKMRAAIGQVQKPLSEMKQHMTMCTQMMGMMEKMHGGMMKDTHASMIQTEKQTTAKVVDPVCGMEVDPKTSESAIYKGKTYYLCSKEEKEKFQKNPEQYINK